MIMLENAKVTMSLRECDDLRVDSKELGRIQRLIANAVEVIEPKEVKDGEDFPKVKLIVDTEKIKNLIWEYYAWRKDDREYISETWE